MGQVLPMVALRGLTVFPHMVVNFDVARAMSVQAIDAALASEQKIFLATQKEIDVEKPSAQDICDVGCVAHVKQVLKMPGDIVTVMVEGITRAKVNEYRSSDPYFIVEVEEYGQTVLSEEEQLEVEALIHLCRREFEEFSHLSNRISSNAVDSIGNINEPARFTDIIAANVLEEVEEKQKILECYRLVERMELLLSILMHENQRLGVEKKISLRVKKQIDKLQKEYYLREQMKAIQKELGDKDGGESDELTDRVENSDMPEEVCEKALKELERMSKMSQGMPEISVIRTYVEWLLDLPWVESTEDNMDLDNAEKILSEDHYGLEKVKERVIEYLAVRQLKKDMKGPILCFVGPPGVGKTSIARSIARSLGRKFVRMSLGGVRDEAEIRGHRRTYIGAIPGRIIACMKQAGTVNPLFLFDEIDKMGNDFRGDPASAMLEVLDTEQNNAFRDHYLEVPYDLSNVMFIATANSVDTIPRPLLDRMELIELGSYTDLEKLEIAKRHLLHKQEEENGLKNGTLEIDDELMLQLIHSYTREAGVRSLERVLGRVCRKAARAVASGRKRKIKLTNKLMAEYLGAPRYLKDALAGEALIGTVTGLAWTAVGGETLSIDVALMPGSGELTLTGQLGDVMKESARAALSLIRSRSVLLGIDEKFSKETDIHIHIPQGAIPKDGPSAGVTLYTAMVSALTGIPAKGDVAMTGEITLRGRVLPIGGLKEKALAAHRAGIKTIIIPKENKKDIEDIPESVQSELNIILADNVDTVLNIALTSPANRRKNGDKKS